ncbi:MAG TPA: Na(+)/H(+) antiporter subunit D [Burkholderiales bacterium]|nr:Na(+)/H(+) antiporter subunit D [Burkholderiales bacterium]
MNLFHPGLILALGGLLLGALPARARPAATLVLPLLALWALWALPEGILWKGEFLGVPVAPLAVDPLSRLFATIFALMAFAGGLFALRQQSRLEVPAAYIYAGSAIGVTLAGDLATVFVFWELMAVGSTLVIWSGGSAAAWHASKRYFAIHLLGGMLLFAGIMGHVVQTGELYFTRIALDSPAQWLILAGFLINAGAPPLSAWLPDAYPEASWSGMVFLSAFTTKTAVYVLLRGFPGTELLIWVGLYMVMYGIIYALLENDMRRILAYSIVNQVGFMVVGIGIGTEMALNGAAAHAFTHILYKALLLMSAGAVLYQTGKRKCTDLGGLFRTMPLTCICGIVGALAISSFPLTSGFISKSMISEAAVHEHLAFVWYMLAAASAGVFLHAGIKFPWFVFFQRDSGLRPADPPWSMRLAMILLAAACIGLGVFYQPLYALLPYPVDYEPYTAAHVLVYLQLLLFSGLAFFVMLNFLRRTLTITLDFDWFYRVPAMAAVRMVERLFDGVRRGVNATASATSSRLNRLLDRWIGSEGVLARTISTGGMAFWLAAILAGYLVTAYW